MLGLVRRWRDRRRRPDDDAALGEEERADNERAEAVSDTLFPGPAQTGTRIWERRIDEEYERPD